MMTGGRSHTGARLRTRGRHEITQMRTAIRPEATALPDTTTARRLGATSRHQAASQAAMVPHLTGILRAAARLQVVARLQATVGHLRVDTTLGRRQDTRRTHVVHRQAHLRMVRHRLHMVRRHRSTVLLGRLRLGHPDTALRPAMEHRHLATARRLPVMELLHQAMVRHLQVMELPRRAMDHRLVTALLLLATARRLPGMVLPLVPRADRHQATGHHLDMGLLPAMGHLRQATGHHQVLEGLPQVMSLAATLAE